MTQLRPPASAVYSTVSARSLRSFRLSPARCSTPSARLVRGRLTGVKHRSVNRDRLSQTVGDGAVVLTVGVLQEKRKFIATNTGDDVRVTNPGAEHLSGCTPSSIPRRCALAFVELTESIGIDEHQHKADVVSGGALALRTRALMELVVPGSLT